MTLQENQNQKQKTVFVLGAGFSKEAGIPLQGNLLKEILERYDDNQNIAEFIKTVFGLDTDHAKQVDLEDIYTPLHQSLTNDEYLKKYSPKELREIEKSLNTNIAKCIDESNGDQRYIQKFANLLISEKMESPTADKTVVFSLNWDMVLDKKIFEFSDKSVINYACQTAGIDKNNQMIPVLTAKERNACKKGDPYYEPFLIIKLLKLHGSLNWSACPKCRRVFVAKMFKGGLRALEEDVPCPKCTTVQLNATLLLPSFQKELQKFHFQQIWTQAAKELSEATKIVFIGYSFPLADFDFRSLITRHLNDNAEVEVVLWDEKGDAENNTDEGKRYRRYFGDKLKKVYSNGAKDYIENHLGITP